MTSLPRRAALLLAVVPVLALSACGTDDGGRATTTAGASPALAQAALAKQADAVCRRFDAEADRLTPPAAGEDATALAVAVSAFYGKLAGIASRQQAALEALRADADARARWDAFLAIHRQATDLVQGIAPAMDAGEAKKAEGIVARVSAMAPKVDAAADALGAGVCGSASGKR